MEEPGSQRLPKLQTYSKVHQKSSEGRSRILRDSRWHNSLVPPCKPTSAPHRFHRFPPLWFHAPADPVFFRKCESRILRQLSKWCSLAIGVWVRARLLTG